jgi:hypothetical protein
LFGGADSTGLRLRRRRGVARVERRPSDAPRPIVACGRVPFRESPKRRSLSLRLLVVASLVAVVGAQTPKFKLPSGPISGGYDANGDGDFVIGSDSTAAIASPNCVYLGASLGVQSGLPGCSATGPAPTSTVAPIGVGFPASIRGVGAPADPSTGAIFMSAAGSSVGALPAAIFGPSPCVVDLEPSTLFEFAPTLHEAPYPSGVRGNRALVPGYPWTDVVVPDHRYFSTRVPDDPSLVGLSLRMQAILLAPTGPKVLSASASATILGAQTRKRPASRDAYVVEGRVRRGEHRRA